jgi:anti-sigma factor ChrR (cupin superfamily)
MELTMRLHADLTERVVVQTRTAAWVASPEPGVERIPLDRDGAEIARATSIVRYAPGSRFAAHEHGRGEELLILDGEFRDEHGVYPAGPYVRNPWGSRHAPSSPRGCTMFVKLRQIPEADRARVWMPAVVQSCVLEAGQDERVITLHTTADEWVAIVRWAAGHHDDDHAHPDGEEIFVLEGNLEDEHGTYDAGTWLRLPRDSRHRPRSPGGCLFYAKRGPRR